MCLLVCYSRLAVFILFYFYFLFQIHVGEFPLKDWKNFWSGPNGVASVCKDKLSLAISYKVGKWTSFPAVLKDSSSMKSYCKFSGEHFHPATMSLFFKYIVERTTNVTLVTSAL